ncbi:MAG TPA: hypothetical protein PLU22_25430, partial [Polyangiaceae bacterium]|nr:hypothetical protein [Polyangiaceae bacterium]
MRQADPGGGAERQLAAEVRAGEAGVVRADVHAQACRVGERAEGTRREQPGPEPERAVGGIGVLGAEREVRLDADGQGERAPVAADDAHVAGETRVADREPSLGREAPIHGEHGFTRALEEQREVDAEPQALGEDQGAAGVGEDLRLDDGARDVTLGVVGDERLAR